MYMCVHRGLVRFLAWMVTLSDLRLEAFCSISSLCASRELEGGRQREGGREGGRGREEREREKYN
jgi:hypothetical protein